MFFSQLGFSQMNFSPAYIVPLNGDTLRGEIDFRNWKSSPDEITFREYETAPERRFTPLDIKRFSVAGQIFISGVVESEISPTTVESAGEGAKLKIQIDTTFLQILAEGKYALCYYKNSDRKEQFYILKDGKFELLIYKRFTFRDSKNELRTTENKKYLGQLTVFMKDCPSMSEDLKDLPYLSEQLEKAFIKYLDCINDKIIYQYSENNAAKEYKASTRVFGLDAGILGGASYSTYDFTAVSSLSSLKMDPSLNPTGGIFLDLTFPTLRRRWQLHNDLIYTSYNFKGGNNAYISSTNYTINDVELGYSFLKYNIMLRYRFPVGNMFLYANAGISRAMAFENKNLLNQDVMYSGSETFKQTKIISNSNPAPKGLVTGLGSSFKNYYIELRYESSGMKAFAPSLEGKSSSYYITAGYKFFTFPKK